MKRRPSSFFLALAGVLTVAALPLSVLGSEPAKADATAAPAVDSPWKTPEPTYGMGIEPGVSIRMDDGVDLVGDVQYPTDLRTGERAPGPFPVLLTQNPYGCDVPNGTPTVVGTLQNVAPADFFVPRGYIFATACVRGTGRSGGELTFLGPREAQDAPRLVQWAAGLRGSNGKVGLTGCSYLGLTQFAAAAAEKTPVQAMAPFCAGTEIFRAGFMGDGVPTQTSAAYSAFSPALITPRAGPFLANMAASMFTGGDLAYDGEFWRDRRRESYVPAIVRNKVPALLWSSYDDVFVAGAQETWAQFQNAYFGRPLFDPVRPGHKVTGRYQVVIGPWEHGGGIDHALLLAWFDTWLKDAPTGLQRTRTPIHVLDRTKGQWVDVASYPGTHRYTALHLGAGELTADPAAAPGAQQIPWARPELPGATLAFTGRPAEQGYGLSGPISATLYAASSNTNLELIATLQEVAPSGAVTELSDGYVVGSLRARDPKRSWYDRNGVMIRPWCICEQDEWLTPGQMTRLDVRLKPVVATIEPGHALRLVLSTQASTVDCTISTDPVRRPAGAVVNDDPCFPTTTQLRTFPGTYTVGFGPGADSVLNLPIVPYHSYAYRGATSVPAPWGRGD